MKKNPANVLATNCTVWDFQKQRLKNISVVKMKFPVKITDDGKLKIADKKRFDDFLLFQLSGKECWLDIEEKKQVRSIKQNSFYWKYLSIIENETGMLASDVHEIAKRKFLPPRFISLKGKEYRLPASTTKLSRPDFSDYLDKISAWCEVPIPNPCENGFACGKDTCSICKVSKPKNYPKREGEIKL